MADKINSVCQVQTRRPDFCAFIVTNQCVMRCKMCYIWKNAKEQNEITIDEWKFFVSKLKGLLDPNVEINFCGGEALLKDGFLDLIKFCTDLNFATSMTTCGFLIDENKSKRINEARLKVLNISMDSLDETKHDFLRGVDGAHKKALQAIDYLDKYRHQRLEIGVQTVISDANLDDILPLVEWANKDSRLNVIYFQPIVQPYNTGFDCNWNKNGQHSFLWPSNLGKVKAIVEELIRLKEKHGYKISNSLIHLKAIKRYFEQPGTFIKKYGCDKGNHLLNVNNEGNIHLCYNYEPLGNIRDRSIDIKELWFSEKANGLRNMMYNCRKNCADVVTCLFEE